MRRSAKSSSDCHRSTQSKKGRVPRDLSDSTMRRSRFHTGSKFLEASAVV
ncbi:hypothetical protein VTN00DRAFT_2739 [Thermoascus crustaceus]